ncbi:TM223 protein, partial [Quiscalus mexicanus]|nr:TM223 protein [Quiscalus mexicanus]
VVLYEHDRSRFFRLVGLFCASQGLFWAYLAHFAFTALRPVPAPAAGAGADDPLRPRDNKWRFGFTASCLTVGSLTVAAGWLLPLRSVARLTLLR